MNKLFSFFTMLLFFSIQVMAQNDEFILGLVRQSTAERVGLANRTAARPGFAIGIRAGYDLNPKLITKIGLMIEQRSSTDIFFGVEHNPTTLNLELQTQVAYRYTDDFTIFAGPQFAFVMTKDCKPATGSCLIPDDPEKYIIPVQAGLNYTFYQNYAAAIYYESMSQEYWPNAFQKAQTFGLDLILKF